MTTTTNNNVIRSEVSTTETKVVSSIVFPTIFPDGEAVEETFEWRGERLCAIIYDSEESLKTI